jgi:hypothetical protein
MSRHALDSRHVARRRPCERSSNAISYKISLPYLVPYKAPEDCPVHQEAFTPKLVAGDTVQGILEAKYVAPYYWEETISGSYSETRFQALL